MLSVGVVRGTICAIVLGTAACSGDPAVSVFVGPGAAATPNTFYDLPFPHDARRLPDGTVDLTGFPSQSLIVDEYVTAIHGHLDGFGLNSGVFMRFDGELAPESLPDPTGSTADDASVYLVDVDPDSPGRGERVPIMIRFAAQGATSMGSGALAAIPYPGFPLREGTTYALVVTDRVWSADGSAVLAGAGFDAVRSSDAADDPDLARAQTAMAPLWRYLDEDGGDERGDVISATVYTTQRATEIVGLLRDRIAMLPAPVRTTIARTADEAGYEVYESTYDAPNFQGGEVPYSEEGGEIVLADDGLPEVQRTETLRFAVVVPDGPVPATGWPIAIYQHGTGGDYMSFVRDGTAANLAGEGIASISMDQVLHGPRNPGGSPELAFFNFTNPYAGRDNVIQGAADTFSLVRLAVGLRFRASGTRSVRFDPNRVLYFGHSQGSTTGAPYVGYASDLKGAVLSGAGGVLYLTLLHKTQPVDIPAVVQSLLRDEPFDEFNPTLHLLQAWIDRADAVNYGPLMVNRPPAGLAPRAVLVTEGFTDHYTPNPNIEAFAVALGGDHVAPTVAEVQGLTLRGRSVMNPPVSGNLGGTTAVLVQYNQTPGSDGHFVVFDVPAATIQARRFLGSLAETGTATLEPF